jgi:hypothetical protein
MFQSWKNNLETRQLSWAQRKITLEGGLRAPGRSQVWSRSLVIGVDEFVPHGT